MFQQIVRVFLTVGLGMLSSWASAQHSGDAYLSLHTVLTSVLRVVSNVLLAAGKT